MAKAEKEDVDKKCFAKDQLLLFPLENEGTRARIQRPAMLHESFRPYRASEVRYTACTCAGDVVMTRDGSDALAAPISSPRIGRIEARTADGWLLRKER
ncbi:hypothetical protein MRX96_011031 [Rhipicephalus microplus]